MKAGCTIGYTPKFIKDPDTLFDALMDALPLQLREVVVNGQTFMQPRQVSWHGPGEFTYSGLTLQPDPWPQELLDVCKQLTDHYKTKFNSVLVNHYRDEKDSVGWHADDEAYFGADPTIATISLGSPRLFCMKLKTGKGRTEKFVLQHGSLFLMGKGVQQEWLHSVPKSNVPIGPRLSLTYRVWAPPE